MAILRQAGAPKRYLCEPPCRRGTNQSGSQPAAWKVSPIGTRRSARIARLAVDDSDVVPGATMEAPHKISPSGRASCGECSGRRHTRVRTRSAVMKPGPIRRHRRCRQTPSQTRALEGAFHSCGRPERRAVLRIGVRDPGNFAFQVQALGRTLRGDRADGKLKLVKLPGLVSYRDRAGIPRSQRGVLASLDILELGGTGAPARARKSPVASRFRLIVMDYGNRSLQPEFSNPTM